MLTDRIKFTEWLAPIPEEEYLRIVYVGKLKISSKFGNGSLRASSISKIKEIINDILGVFMNWNSAHGVSGHLSWTNECHVSQLIEGKAEAVNSLMARIRRDSRVEIYEEFRKKLRTMNPGWSASMCCSFEITHEEFLLVANKNVSLQDLFHSMKNTYEIRREGQELKQFYKITVETFLLKYISIVENVNFSSRK